MIATEQSLVASWFAAEAAHHDLNKTDAVRSLNAACGTRYSLSRINEIAQGGRAHLPRPVRVYMLVRALPYVLDAEGFNGEGLTPAKLRRLAARLA